jgi:hypothetical protein
MFRQKGAITAVALGLVASADAAAPGGAAPSRVPDPRGQAERDVLGFLQEARGHRWVLRHRRGGRRLFSRLYDPRTLLLRNNTQVICRRTPGRHHRGRFYCVVRPARHRLHEGLHVRYVRYSEFGGYFRIKWLYYRRG